MRESEEDQEPVHRAASIKKATNDECITLVNEVSEDQSLIKYRSDQVKKPNVTLEFHGSYVLLCYSHTPSEALVSRTMKI